jgi:hypothetical protein
MFTQIKLKNKNVGLSFCKFMHKKNQETQLEINCNNFCNYKRNLNTPIIDQPSTHAPLCEHNHLERKKSGGSGTISSIVHLRNGCSSYSYFSRETQSHKRKTLAKRSAKYVDFVILLENPTS